jgi:hypothetical protein
MEDSQYWSELKWKLDILNESRYKPGSPNRFIIDDVYEMIYNEAVREFMDALNEPPKKGSGFVYWGKLGSYSRKFDLPAHITNDGVKSWYLNGTFGRENDKPHRIYPCGKCIWFRDGYAEVSRVDALVDALADAAALPRNQ